MVLGLKQLKLAAGILAGLAKAGDQTGVAAAIDLALKATDFGETLRKQDPPPRRRLNSPTLAA